MELLHKIKKHKIARLALGILVGGILGYLYYSLVGCEGGCPITSKPTNTVLYGMIAGGLISWQ